MNPGFPREFYRSTNSTPAKRFLKIIIKTGRLGSSCHPRGWRVGAWRVPLETRISKGGFGRGGGHGMEWGLKKQWTRERKKITSGFREREKTIRNMENCKRRCKNVLGKKTEGRGNELMIIDPFIMKDHGCFPFIKKKSCGLLGLGVVDLSVSPRGDLTRGPRGRRTPVSERWRRAPAEEPVGPSPRSGVGGGTKPSLHLLDLILDHNS